MAFFQIYPSSKSTPSLTVLGSSSIIEKEKFERKSNEVYISGSLSSRTDLLNNGV
jgi:hypothetical protein